jgi:LacI family transcriptional regulator
MSIQLLADSLGLSTSTVSRALNGYRDVSAATRARVEEAAARLNYSPHPMAHRLATGKTGAIALVTSVRAGNYLDVTFAALMSGAAETLRHAGYFTLCMGVPMGEQEMPEFRRLLQARLVDAVMVARTRIDDPRVALLQELGMPFVTHGRTLHNAPHAWVDTDNEYALQAATQALLDLGHRRIAFINGPHNMTYAVLRERGFRKAMEAAQVLIQEGAVVHTDVLAEAAQSAAAQILQSIQPTAIVCATDAQALGAMQAIKAAGLRVGVDVSLTGYGNTDAVACVEPPLASIDHSIVENGRHLAQLLLRRMAGESPHALQQLESARFVARASIGPAPV